MGQAASGDRKIWVFLVPKCPFLKVNRTPNSQNFLACGGPVFKGLNIKNVPKAREKIAFLKGVFAKNVSKISIYGLYRPPEPARKIGVQIYHPSDPSLFSSRFRQKGGSLSISSADSAPPEAQNNTLRQGFLTDFSFQIDLKQAVFFLAKNYAPISSKLIEKPCRNE